jgi:hypothetical protein
VGAGRMAWVGEQGPEFKPHYHQKHNSKIGEKLTQSDSEKIAWVYGLGWIHWMSYQSYLRKNLQENEG